MTIATETFLFLFALFVAIVVFPELIYGAIVIVVAVLLIFFVGMIIWFFGAKINLEYDGRKYILRWFSLKEVE